MSTAHVAAQAKVNLTLRILARETSGFHQIETVFQRLALADTVTVRETAGRSLDVRFADATRATDLGPVEQNLAWRAAEAYAAVAGWPLGFAIEIEKCIPVGGGLGGGSADAAAVLRGLDALAVRPIGQAALLELAARLGADVAFLASPSELAVAWGRGDRLFDLSPLPTASVLLVVPDFGVNTARAYGDLAALRAAASAPNGAGASESANASANASASAGAAWRSPRSLGSWGAVAQDAINEFESVVFPAHPELGLVCDSLAALPQVVLARMSGSGSTLFAVLAASGGPRPGGPSTGAPLELPPRWSALHTTTAAAAPVEIR